MICDRIYMYVTAGRGLEDIARKELIDVNADIAIVSHVIALVRVISFYFVSDNTRFIALSNHL